MSSAALKTVCAEAEMLNKASQFTGNICVLS